VAHPEFGQALRIAKEVANERVEASLYHRAVGYSHPAIKIMQYEGVPVIEPYVEHVPPDIGAITLWLTNRKGAEWRNKTSREISGPDGGPIETTHVDSLTEAELEAIARAGSPAPAEPETGSD
jgi:hypothetical protein